MRTMGNKKDHRRGKNWEMPVKKKEKHFSLAFGKKERTHKRK